MKKTIDNSRIETSTKFIVLVAVIASLLTVSKLAVSFIPNVEPVTLLIMIFASTLGIAYILPSVLVFCSIELLLYGIASWSILYFVYWPLLAIVSSYLLRNKNIVLAITISIVFSILFGVLSACCDTLVCVFNLSSDELAEYFVAYYLRGLYFDLIHVVSNAIIILVLYMPLCSVMKKILPKEYYAFQIKSKKLINFEDVYERE